MRNGWKEGTSVEMEKYSVNKHLMKIAYWKMTAVFERYFPRDTSAVYHDSVGRYRYRMNCQNFLKAEVFPWIASAAHEASFDVTEGPQLNLYFSPFVLMSHTKNIKGFT